MRIDKPGLITVFGGSGFVGSAVVAALARRGWRIKVAVRRPSLAHDLKPLGDSGQIQPVRCDVTDRASVDAALAGADAAVNLVGVLFETPSRSFQRMHADGSANVAESCAAAGIGRLVQISAIGADPASPSEYGRSKAEAEARVRAAVPTAVILRPSIVFGDGDSFLNRFAAMATLAPALPLIGGGRTRFQPVHVGDVAEAVARSLERPDAAGGLFELGGPAVLTFEEVLRYILRETGRSRMLVPLPFPVARAMGSAAQLTTFVGIEPPLTRDQVLLLQSDNVVAEGARGLPDLDITPTGIEAIAPHYLWRYRRGGQFAEGPRRQGDAPLPA